MANLSLYHWDYDRRQPTVDPPFLTFSIAIFQWQRKASGKGLKKINASRVCGYAADPESMYAKAQEICDLLNNQYASVLKRPKWLQKQYSVPRPKWLIKEPDGDELAASVVRSIRESVMKRLLLPEGFVKAAHATYAREREGQIHLLYFQGSKWGKSYTVNLGFHYSFIKPFFASKQIPLREYHFLDCAFQSRIGDHLTGRDVWFDYGTDRAALTKCFEQNVADCLEALAKYSERWASPKRWQSATLKTLRRRTTPWEVMEPQRFLKELQRYRNEE